jgi:hypothetical protein
MKRTTLSPLAVLLVLAPQAFGQDPAPQEAPVTLARARSLFAEADRDGDGKVTLREAQAAGHSLADFRAFDANADGSIVGDEFLVGYADGVTGRGQAVGRDLADEAARIRAQRQERRREAAGDDGAASRRGADEPNAGDAQRRTDAQREKIRTSGIDPARVENQIEKLQGAQETPATPPNARSRATNALSRLREATRDARQERRAEAARSDGEASDAPPSAGPGARRSAGADRSGPSPEDLRRILDERQRRAVSDSRDDPRVEEARERVQAERRESAGSSTRGDGTRGSATNGARTGGSRGPAGGRTGRAGSSRSGGSRGN